MPIYQIMFLFQVSNLFLKLSYPLVLTQSLRILRHHFTFINHNLAFPVRLAPTEQHERMDIQRLRNPFHARPTQMGQLNSFGLELIRVLPCLFLVLVRGHFSPRMD